MRQINHQKFSSNIVENSLVVILDDVSDHILDIIETDVLNTIQRKSLKGVIFDISKITIIDSVSASRLCVLANVIEAMGSIGIVTGIRAEVAFCMVSLDVDFQSLHTELNIEEAFKYLKEDETVIDEPENENEELREESDE